MRANLLNRRVHYWAGVAAALPLLVVIATGILLQLKKQIAWVQPPEARGTRGEPLLGPAQVLEACRGVPEAGVAGWGDVARIDLRPDRGLYKVTSRSDWEVQIDARTGEVLRTAYRRSDIIESMHDGSWFHPLAKLWLFLPAGVLLLVLWLSGVYLSALPYWVRWRRRRRA